MILILQSIKSYHPCSHFSQRAGSQRLDEVYEFLSLREKLARRPDASRRRHFSKFYRTTTIFKQRPDDMLPHLRVVAHTDVDNAM